MSGLVTWPDAPAEPRVAIRFAAVEDEAAAKTVWQGLHDLMIAELGEFRCGPVQGGYYDGKNGLGVLDDAEDYDPELRRLLASGWFLVMAIVQGRP